MSLRLAEITDFLEFCRKYNFEYDFTMKGLYFTTGLTEQAFALYRLAVEKGVKIGQERS